MFYFCTDSVLPRETLLKCLWRGTKSQIWAKFLSTFLGHVGEKISNPPPEFLLCCVTSNSSQTLVQAACTWNLSHAALSDEAPGPGEGTEKQCECLAEIKWKVAKPENPFLGHVN